QILQAATGLFLRRPYADVSITDIAEAAGVARGLLHHYFESKRALYLEVVRDVSRASTHAVPRQRARAASDDLGWGRAIDGLLSFAESNRTAWVSAALLGGSEGDHEVSDIIDEAREVIAEQLIAGLGLTEADSPELRAVVRGYGGLVQEVGLEWLERGRLTREQARTVLVRALPLLLEEVLPAIAPTRTVRP
ncbi:MAG TPA: TetR/AcrR family transcriptional regulator, partial [Acidimicrobiales bacterium]|nr:TetR/AcrR family transcriptional regulator [Acidimicrobiales bacterium]